MAVDACLGEVDAAFGAVVEAAEPASSSAWGRRRRGDRRPCRRRSRRRADLPVPRRVEADEVVPLADRERDLLGEGAQGLGPGSPGPPKLNTREPSRRSGSRARVRETAIRICSPSGVGVVDRHRDRAALEAVTTRLPANAGCRRRRSAAHRRGARAASTRSMPATSDDDAAAIRNTGARHRPTCTGVVRAVGSRPWPVS